MSTGHDHASSGSVPFSLARLSLAQRLAVAAGLSALVWLVILPLIG
jgi:hypothetical protein